MAGMTMVMFEKWTTLTVKATATTTYRSEWFDVTGYSQTTVTVFLKNNNAGVTTKIQVEQSGDLDSFADAATLTTLTEGQERNVQVPSTARYVRAAIVLEGGATVDGAATLWVKAVAREAL